MTRRKNMMYWSLAWNRSGRTGRGDTTFAGYITERQRAGIAEALRYCTALVSPKVETPGPFWDAREDVLAYIEEILQGPKRKRLHEITVEGGEGVGRTVFLSARV